MQTQLQFHGRMKIKTLLIINDPGRLQTLSELFHASMKKITTVFRYFPYYLLHPRSGTEPFSVARDVTRSTKGHARITRSRTNTMRRGRRIRPKKNAWERQDNVKETSGQVLEFLRKIKNSQLESLPTGFPSPPKK